MVNSELMTKILCCQVASMLLLGANPGTYTGLELMRIDLRLLKFVAVLLFASFSITYHIPDASIPNHGQARITHWSLTIFYRYL
jgi:hypothetical protein